MSKLRESHVIEDLPAMGTSLERIACASCGIDVVRRLLHDDDPADEMYHLLWGWLCQLHQLPADDTPRMLLALRWFELQVLRLQGVAPQLARCYRSGKPLSVLTRPGFSARGGGVIDFDVAGVVEEMSDERDMSSEQDVVLVDRKVIAGMHRLLCAVDDLDGVLHRAAERRHERGDAQLLRFVERAGHLHRKLLEEVVPGRSRAYHFLNSLLDAGRENSLADVVALPHALAR